MKFLWIVSILRYVKQCYRTVSPIIAELIYHSIIALRVLLSFIDDPTRNRYTFIELLVSFVIGQLKWPSTKRYDSLLIHMCITLSEALLLLNPIVQKNDNGW